MNNDFSWLDDLEKEMNQVLPTQHVELTVTLLTNSTGEQHRICFQGYDQKKKLSEKTYIVDCKIFVGAFEYLNTLAAALELEKRMEGENN